MRGGGFALTKSGCPAAYTFFGGVGGTKRRLSSARYEGRLVEWPADAEEATEQVDDEDG